MMDTGLVLLVPEVEPIVSTYRSAHDTSAAAGLPAHITVLYPFRPFEQIDEAFMARIAEVLADSNEIDISFRRQSRFPGVLWLAPEPAEAIIELTEKLVSHFPEYPPYGGVYETITPHLTVATGEDDLLEDLADDITEALRTPVTARIRSCVLYAYDTERWLEKRSFPFGGQTS